MVLQRQLFPTKRCEEVSFLDGGIYFTVQQGGGVIILGKTSGGLEYVRIYGVC